MVICEATGRGRTRSSSRYRGRLIPFSFEVAQPRGFQIIVDVADCLPVDRRVAGFILTVYPQSGLHFLQNTFRSYLLTLVFWPQELTPKRTSLSATGTRASQWKRTGQGENGYVAIIVA